MPIANCFVSPLYKSGLSNGNRLIDIWSKESGKPSDEMTINIIHVNEQVGKQYSVIANLVLPSIWSSDDITKLQIGLAHALSKFFEIHLSEILVDTNIVNTGMVVESGKEVQW